MKLFRRCTGFRSGGFVWNIAACAGMAWCGFRWACAAFRCAGQGWRVLWCGGQVLVDSRGQEHRLVLGQDDRAEVVNVLLNPWKVRGLVV